MEPPAFSRCAVRLRARVQTFTGAQEQAHHLQPLTINAPSTSTTDFAGATWGISLAWQPVADRDDALDGVATFTLAAGAVAEASVALEFLIDDWAKENFVLLPAAAYDGNRFACRPYNYPPMIHEAPDIGLSSPIVITDVPRLTIEDGAPSRLQILTGDETTPSLTFFSRRHQYGFILLTEQGSRWGNHGLTIEESPDRAQAVLRLEAPGVRRDTLYTMTTTATPSWDRGATWQVGDEVVLRFRLFIFPAEHVHDLYDRFSEVRKDVTGPVTLPQSLPYSAAWQILEEKYLRTNWRAEGYFSVSPQEERGNSKYNDWQLGWVGGGIMLHPMLSTGSAELRARAMQNLEWMFSTAQHQNGLFYAVYSQGQIYGDGFDLPGTDTWYMVRKQADALYFLVKIFHLLAQQDPAWQLPEQWKAGTLKLADVFVQAFRTYGQIGQYLDRDTGAVVVGGSTASAMVPAALALTGQYFDVPAYIEAAEHIAQQLYTRDVQAGVTTGGPGEILKCPDSESAFAMLESLVVLYEVTGDKDWLPKAEAMAKQCLTWCASYDYRFPADSWFGRLGIHAAGSVWANVQNKHSAPGICTLSGDSLFKLFRYTGNQLYLQQIHETAHNLPQYLSRADRSVGDPAIMKPGWMCERVNFSDWERPDGVGGFLFGSCWCETSLMLTTVEIPGIYVQPDTGLVCAFDNIDVRILEHTATDLVLQCSNPTSFDAQVRVLVEPSSRMGAILGQNALLPCPVITVPARDTRTFVIHGTSNKLAVLGCE